MKYINRLVVVVVTIEHLIMHTDTLTDTLADTDVT